MVRFKDFSKTRKAIEKVIQKKKKETAKGMKAEGIAELKQRIKNLTQQKVIQRRVSILSPSTPQQNHQQSFLRGSRI